MATATVLLAESGIVELSRPSAVESSSDSIVVLTGSDWRATLRKSDSRCREEANMSASRISRNCLCVAAKGTSQETLTPPGTSTCRPSSFLCRNIYHNHVRVGQLHLVDVAMAYVDIYISVQVLFELGESIMFMFVPMMKNAGM